MAQNMADKLIAKAAKETLKPIGLFQKGASRIWIDDNGWFLTVVEFQPSSWSKGAYLNVTISFLWDQGTGFADVLPYNIGGRELDHEQYKGNDEVFYMKMLQMAQHAKNKVEEYRKYAQSLSYAVSQIQIKNTVMSQLKVIDCWNKGMFYYFSNDEKAGGEQMKLLLTYSVKEREYEFEGKMYVRDFIIDYVKSAEQILLKESKEKKQYVIQSIIEKRRRLRAKASYKKLPVNAVFQ